ncbi:MAG: preprotein translocase subunit SecG [Paludibacteraceae bacterium]|nr:preprotein translocase subunit SecG [Paludibacteraceae bacterium]
MYTFFTILIVIVAILLILLVLVQNSKGGGLAAGFASGNQVMGAPKTTDFLEKASWTLAGIIVVLSILAVGVNRGQQSQSEVGSAIMEQVDEAASQLPQQPAADFATEAAATAEDAE